jgi:predicted O-methyltransferase YrrM
MEQTWAAVDDYLAALVAPEDADLRAAAAASAQAGLPAIQVSPLQGKLLMLLARLSGAQRILEIGTLGGYSTIWLARGTGSRGRVITLELDPKHAEVARANLARAGLAARVEVRVGPAADSLARLAEEGAGPFDLVFIDADKPSNPEYLQATLRLSRPGTLIIADNVVRSGGIIDEASADAAIAATRRFHQMVAADSRLDATVVQTVGSKGYDGFTLAIVQDALTGRPSG